MPKLIIGITGSFGSGKTFVASLFRSFGARVLDADSIAHAVIAKGKRAHKEIVRTFGREILNSRGSIDRARLAAIAFSKKDNLKKLGRIIHPEVIKVIKEKIGLAGRQEIIVIDAPLLIEANAHRLADRLVVVKASARKQIERCMKKFCMSEEDVLKRIENQMPLKKKMRLADFVIDNDGTRSETRKQARKVWGEIVWK